MLTRHETRALYVLTTHDGRALLSTMSQAMQRVPADDRRLALVTLEDLGLISSAKTPPAKGKTAGARGGGPGGTVYWLTDAGKAFVEDAIASGDMKDPSKEPRRGKGGDHVAA